MKRVFAIDVLACEACGGPMRILAVLPAGDAPMRLQEHRACVARAERAAVVAVVVVRDAFASRLMAAHAR